MPLAGSTIRQSTARPNLSAPHGGRLISRLIGGEEAEALRREAAGLPRLDLDPVAVCDLETIAIGAFSPLTGFMGEADYLSVIADKHLESGLPWTIPITLNLQETGRVRPSPGARVALGAPGEPVSAVLDVSEIYTRDAEREAELVFGTADRHHPGAARVLDAGPTAVAGLVTVFARPVTEFGHYRLDPAETRLAFAERDWRTVVGFQTRNPVHRAHEYIQKSALEIVDGLLLHPLVGETKSDDIPAKIRMRCYEVLLDEYYPKNRVLLAILPAAMRYAGPREAVLHAIVRKNYGCTHFIVGRDHAGVGDYYGSFDAHYIFDEFAPDELGIVPLFFDHTFYCRRCSGMASYKTCPHAADQHVVLSGTKVRQLLGQGRGLPAEFSRPEVAKVLEGWVEKEATGGDKDEP